MMTRVATTVRILACICILAIPRIAPGADFAGVWTATSPRSAGGVNRTDLTLRAQADLDALDPLGDSMIRCVLPGFPRNGLIIYPFGIIQTDEVVLLLDETFAMMRRIYMDGREMPARKQSGSSRRTHPECSYAEA